MPGRRRRNPLDPRAGSARRLGHSTRSCASATPHDGPPAYDARMAMTFDPRVTPARPDLAAAHLAGHVPAARFVAGDTREVIEPQAALRHAPSPDAPLDTEALRGERVTVYETTEEGWAWGQLEADGYVGWLSANELGRPGPAPTHSVVALRTLVFSGPSIKSPPLQALSLGCQLAVERMQDGLAVLRDGFVPAVHLVPIDTREADFVSVAERFVGAPYLWG